MDRTLALCLIGGFVALAIFSGWRGARPPDPRRGPRMVPWRPLMVAAATGALILAAYLVQTLPGR